jgi:hypothetical protein
MVKKTQLKDYEVEILKMISKQGDEGLSVKDLEEMDKRIDDDKYKVICIQMMKKGNLIEGWETENGEIHFFLSERGKEAVKDI